MSLGSLGMTMERRDSVRMWVSRSEGWACLVLHCEEAQCEIRMERVHVETLRDHLPEVLAGMTRWAAEDAVRARAETAGVRAVDAATTAVDLAASADAAGAHGVAVSLRETAAKVTASANAMDDMVEAVGNAASDVDSAVDNLIFVTREAETVLRRLRDDDRPAALATP